MHSVVVIDDSYFNIRILEDILSDDYRIYSATNGEDGIELVKRLKPSIVLVDIIMPGMDGFQVIQEMKKDPVISEIPVIFLTGLSDEDNEELGFRLGAVDYIIRPLRAGIVRARVKTHIQIFEQKRLLENYAMIDSLTGVANRRSYEKRVKLDWQFCMAQKQYFSIAMVDVDYFKQYNDTYGHGEGDSVLQVVAAAIERKIRKDCDFVARYGGEEFFISLQNKNAQEAEDILNDIGEFIKKFHIEHKNSDCDHYVTVSAGGVTVIPEEGEELEKYLGIADQNLYMAKKNGRNRVVWS